MMNFREGVLAAAKAIGLERFELIELPNGSHRFLFLGGAWPIEWIVPEQYCVWQGDARSGPGWQKSLRELAEMFHR